MKGRDGGGWGDAGKSKERAQRVVPLQGKTLGLTLQKTDSGSSGYPERRGDKIWRAGVSEYRKNSRTFNIQFEQDG
jgi:hypothetical protein